MAQSASIIIIVKERKMHLSNILRGIHMMDVPDSIHLDVNVIHMNEAADPAPSYFKHDFYSDTISSYAPLPLARARNYGAKCAKSDNLIFLDVDCIPNSQFITDYMKALNDFPNAIFMGEVYYMNKPLPQEWNEHTLTRYGTPHPKRTYLSFEDYKKETHYQRFWSLNFALKRDVFRNIRGFDEGFVGYGAEDTDFISTAEQLDIPLLWIKGATVYHQYHGENTLPLHHFDDIVRNAKTYHLKWNTWPMQKWLNKFAEMQYILWTPNSNDITVLRHPSQTDIHQQKAA